MSNTKTLLNLQYDLCKRIERAKINFKKSPKERITIQYLESRLEALELLWKEFLKGHSNLVSAFTEEQYSEIDYCKNEYYDKMEDIYIELKSEIKIVLTRLNVQSNVTPNDSSNSDKKPCQVKLPKIHIPSFSGKYSEWNTFRDLYCSLIHNNKDLENVQKLHYLKGYLTGEAEQLLRHIPIESTNYQRCWSLLEERYNNKKYICHHILKRLFSQRNILNESASALKDLIDTTNDCLAGLSNLGIDIKSWDVIIIHILTLKLDAETRREWEFNVTNNNTSDELPTYKQFKEFLTNRYRAMEFLVSKSNAVNKPYAHSSKNNNVSDNKFKSLHVTKSQCPFCTEEHQLKSCKKFAKETVESRREFVQSNNVCFCCLGSKHSAKACNKNVKCHICNRKHHTLLHPKGSGNSEEVENNREKNVSSSATPSTAAVTTDTVALCSSTKKEYNQVLLATALVNIATRAGDLYTVRALLDQGSQSSFVTESTVQQLGLKKIPIKGEISGVGGNKSIISKSMVNMQMSSRVDPKVEINVKAYVLKSITTLLPVKEIKMISWPETTEMILADPKYNIPGKIDLLLGAEVYGQVLQEGIKKSLNGTTIAQSTSLGWILSGGVNTVTEINKKINVMHITVDENDLLKKFWELEKETEIQKDNNFTEEERKCEEFFQNTTKRDAEGRYIVKLPFRKESPECLQGNSKKIATTRFLALEKRLNKKENLNKEYKRIFEEYLDLQYMAPVKEEEKNKEGVYLPYHEVIREDKDTTKVRVVMNASSKGNNGVSLNDDLMVGPTLQLELRHILIRWRTHPIVLVSDVVKMYHQIKVDEEDANFQRIVWRDNPNKELVDYKLLRVTFGTACAPYLAVKCLMQLAFDEGMDYPIAAAKVKTDFYMDDLLTGCQTMEEGLQLFREMNALLAKGGFELQKWSCNNEELMKKLKEENCKEREKGKEGTKMGNTGKDIQESKNSLKIKTDEIIKIIGLTWNRSDDCFRYTVQLTPLKEPVTKRKIISDISRFYDPLGWVGPCIIKAKIIIQQLWLAGIEWDEEVPNSILNEWLTYRDELIILGQVRISRWIGTKNDDVRLELHGFSDASKVAYAAVVYVRRIDANQKVDVQLLSAKTKVAPIKQVSIPRLELCGAVLLTKLMIEIATVMNIDKHNLHAWTDSSVVLSWLNSHASRWKVFVANRVSEIQTHLDAHYWSHVATKENPADIASRGAQPSELLNNNMWFQGPEFLHNEHINYQKPKNINTEQEQIKTHCATNDSSLSEIGLLARFSSFNRMIRVLSYCRRFVNNIRHKNNRLIGYLNTQELTDTLKMVIRQSQAFYFETEINHIKTNKPLSKSSSLRSLNPWLDEDNILRVGGRLNHSSLKTYEKHPIILHKEAQLTTLIIGHAHKQTMHGGPQLMMCYIQTKYWIGRLKQLVKAYYRKCVTCIKTSNSTQTQLMGQLPAARVTPSRPFKCSGVDYAGPIKIRTSKGRGYKSHKGYICLFVCMVTRAVHLDVVTELTSDGFLQVFKRFVARRGYCTDLWSDNATNFTGAASELKRLILNENKQMFTEVAESLATEGCTWHFIPSRSPNFGGLWEAGVKSVKGHLKRIIGQSTLTFEEMSTVLAQIEACLNSRPLSVITGNDIEEFTVLTPGHFLVGEPLITLPDRNYEDENISSLKRWQYQQKMVQDFWRRWSSEYLTKYYHRYRWATQQSQPKIGDVVIVREDGLPPCRWLYGRIEAVHPGTDNIVRVVTLKVKNGTLKRPISKLCFLPISE